MGILSGLTGSLFGKKGKPSETRSGLSELINLFPELKDVGGDIITRGTGLADTTDVFTPAQIAQLSDLEQQGLAGIAGAGAGFDLISDAQPFRPQFGFGQQANQAFRGASDLFGQVSPALQRAGGLIDRGVDPITGEQISAGISQFMNPFERDVVASAARDARESGLGLLSDIAGQATGAGAFGSTRQALLESQVPELVAQQVGDLSGRLRQGGFESAAGRALDVLTGDRSRALTGAGLGIQQAGQFAGAGAGLGNLGSQLFGARQGVQDIQSQQFNDQLARLRGGLSTSQAQLQAGQLPRQIQQAGLTRDAQIGQIPLQQLRLLQGVMGGFPTGSTQIGATAPTGGLLSSGGNIGQGIGTLSGIGSSGGTLSGALGGLTSFFSDFRLKENIEFVQSSDGINIYEFEYKNKNIGDGRYRGVIAQEVENICPNAVKEVGGYKMVDYGMINVDMRRVG